MSKVVILSGAIQSGKTTTLLKRFSKSSSVGVFICPDVHGQRMMYFCSENRLVPFQKPDDMDAVKIGKFLFDKVVFNKACDILVSPLALDNDFVIVDEVGPLELNENGFYQSLVSLLNAWEKKDNGSLILVVREHLVNDVIAKFDLKNVDVCVVSDFLNNEDSSFLMNAVILSGGQSSRMKTEKYLLKYEGVEQYKRIQNMMNLLAINCYLSCNENQNKNESLSIDTIVDDELFFDAGPLTGILSSFEKLQSDLFVIGCDYPLLNKQHLEVMKQFAMYGFNEIAFVKNDRPDFVEPLICFLSKKSLIQLRAFYFNGGRSLNKFLQQSNPLKIQLDDDAFLRSFDTQEDYNSYSKNQ
jgi:hypothetical protein